MLRAGDAPWGRPGPGRPFAYSEAWAPLDHALRAYRSGRGDASVVMWTDVAGEEEAPAALFFRGVEDMPAVERGAMDLARGRVLDLGAGAGAHAVVLSQAGLETTAVELLPTACEILQERGIEDVRAGGLEAVGAHERFDTVLVLMNGLGLAGSLEGLAPFLLRLESLLAPGGQVLADSTDPRSWGESGDGRYAGEVHMQLAFDGRAGPPFPFLFVDSDMLARIAAPSDLRTEVIVHEDDGRYLARLVRATD